MSDEDFGEYPSDGDDGYETRSDSEEDYGEVPMRKSKWSTGGFPEEEEAREEDTRTLSKGKAKKRERRVRLTEKEEEELEEEEKEEIEAERRQKSLVEDLVEEDFKAENLGEEDPENDDELVMNEIINHGYADAIRSLNEVKKLFKVSKIEDIDWTKLTEAEKKKINRQLTLQSKKARIGENSGVKIEFFDEVWENDPTSVIAKKKTFNNIKPDLMMVFIKKSINERVNYQPPWKTQDSEWPSWNSKYHYLIGIKKIELDAALHELNQIKVKWKTTKAGANKLASLEERLSEAEALAQNDVTYWRELAEDMAQKLYPEDLAEDEILLEGLAKTLMEENDLYISLLADEIKSVAVFQEMFPPGERRLRVFDEATASRKLHRILEQDYIRYKRIEETITEINQTIAVLRGKIKSKKYTEADRLALARLQADVFFYEEFPPETLDLLSDQEHLNKVVQELQEELNEVMKAKEEDWESQMEDIRKRFAALLFHKTPDMTSREEKKAKELKEKILQIRKDIERLSKEQEEYHRRNFVTDFLEGIPEEVALSYVKITNSKLAVAKISKNGKEVKRLVINSHRLEEDPDGEGNDYIVVTLPGDPEEQRYPVEQISIIQNGLNPFTNGEYANVSDVVLFKPYKDGPKILGVVIEYEKEGNGVTVRALPDSTKRLWKKRKQKIDARIAFLASQEYQETKIDLLRSIRNEIIKGEAAAEKKELWIENLALSEESHPEKKKIEELQSVSGKLEELMGKYTPKKYKVSYEHLKEYLSPTYFVRKAKNVMDAPITSQQLDYLRKKYISIFRTLIPESLQDPKAKKETKPPEKPEGKHFSQEVIERALFTEWCKKCSTEASGTKSKEMLNRANKEEKEDKRLLPDVVLERIIKDLTLPDGTTPFMGLDVVSGELSIVSENLRRVLSFFATIAGKPSSSGTTRFKLKLLKAFGQENPPPISILLRDAVNEEVAYRRGLPGPYGEGLTMAKRLFLVKEEYRRECTLKYYSSDAEVEKFKNSRMGNPAWLKMVLAAQAKIDQKIQQEQQDLAKKIIEETSKEQPEEAILQVGMTTKEISEQVEMMLKTMGSNITFRGACQKLNLIYILTESPIAIKFKYFKQAIKNRILPIATLLTISPESLAPELYLSSSWKDPKKQPGILLDLKYLEHDFIYKTEKVFSGAEARIKPKARLFPYNLEEALVDISEYCKIIEEVEGKQGQRMMTIKEVAAEYAKSLKVKRPSLPAGVNPTDPKVVAKYLPIFEGKARAPIPVEDIILEMATGTNTVRCVSIREIIQDYHYNGSKYSSGQKKNRPLPKVYEDLAKLYKVPEKLTFFSEETRKELSLQAAADWILEVYRSSVKEPVKETLVESPTEEEPPVILTSEKEVKRDLHRIWFPWHPKYLSTCSESIDLRLCISSENEKDLFGEEPIITWILDTAIPEAPYSDLTVLIPIHYASSPKEKIGDLLLNGKADEILSKAKFVLPVVFGYEKGTDLAHKEISLDFYKNAKFFERKGATILGMPKDELTLGQEKFCEDIGAQNAHKIESYLLAMSALDRAGAIQQIGSSGKLFNSIIREDEVVPFRKVYHTTEENPIEACISILYLATFSYGIEYLNSYPAEILDDESLEIRIREFLSSAFRKPLFDALVGDLMGKPMPTTIYKDLVKKFLWYGFTQDYPLAYVSDGANLGGVGGRWSEVEEYLDRPEVLNYFVEIFTQELFGRSVKYPRSSDDIEASIFGVDRFTEEESGLLDVIKATYSIEDPEEEEDLHRRILALVSSRRVKALEYIIETGDLNLSKYEGSALLGWDTLVDKIKDLWSKKPKDLEVIYTAFDYPAGPSSKKSNEARWLNDVKLAYKYLTPGEKRSLATLVTDQTQKEVAVEAFVKALIPSSTLVEKWDKALDWYRECLKSGVASDFEGFSAIIKYHPRRGASAQAAAKEFADAFRLRFASLKRRDQLKILGFAELTPTIPNMKSSLEYLRSTIKAPKFVPKSSRKSAKTTRKLDISEEIPIYESAPEKKILPRRGAPKMSEKAKSKEAPKVRLRSKLDTSISSKTLKDPTQKDYDRAKSILTQNLERILNTLNENAENQIMDQMKLQTVTDQARSLAAKLLSSWYKTIAFYYKDLRILKRTPEPGEGNVIRSYFIEKINGMDLEALLARALEPQTITPRRFFLLPEFSPKEDLSDIKKWQARQDKWDEMSSLVVSPSEELDVEERTTYFRSQLSESTTSSIHEIMEKEGVSESIAALQLAEEEEDFDRAIFVDSVKKEYLDIGLDEEEARALAEEDYY